MDKIFGREEMIIGNEALRYLQNCHVKVFGIGGVGSYAAEALARAGVGHITLIDRDTVSESNINRQLCALHSTLGLNKSDVMRDRILDINPSCDVVSIPSHYDDAHADLIFNTPCDYIIDAIDLVSCKLSLIKQADAHGIPIISCLGTGNKLDPTRFQITDISKTEGCPLARVMRKELKKRGIIHHTVLFSNELAFESFGSDEPLPPGRRSIPGSLSWVPSCAGLMVAGYVISELIGRKNPDIASIANDPNYFSAH